MRIRAARRDDFEPVAALLASAGRPALSAASEADVRAVFDEQVVHPDAHHFLAEDDAGLVGFCALHFRTRLGWPTPEAWIADFVVADIARHIETARAMLDEAQRRARDRDSHALVVDSAYREAEHHDLFRELHMRDVGKYFARDLRTAASRPRRRV
jgi:N-acetylglutamate synthase-like GNAT family acetyltransferase